VLFLGGGGWGPVRPSAVVRGGRVGGWAVGGGGVWVAADEHAPRLRRSRVHGPAEVEFAEPVIVTDRGRGGHRHIARPASPRRGGRGQVADVVELGDDRALEIRP